MTQHQWQQSPAHHGKKITIIYTARKTKETMAKQKLCLNFVHVIIDPTRLGEISETRPRVGILRYRAEVKAGKFTCQDNFDVLISK